MASPPATHARSCLDHDGSCSFTCVLVSHQISHKFSPRIRCWKFNDHFHNLTCSLPTYWPVLMVIAMLWSKSQGGARAYALRQVGSKVGMPGLSRLQRNGGNTQQKWGESHQTIGRYRDFRCCLDDLRWFCLSGSRLPPPRWSWKLRGQGKNSIYLPCY